MSSRSACPAACHPSGTPGRICGCCQVGSWLLLQQVGSRYRVGSQEIKQHWGKTLDDALFRFCGEQVSTHPGDGKYSVQVLVEERRPLPVVPRMAFQPDNLLIGVADTVDADQFGCVLIDLRVLKLPIGDTQVRDQPDREGLAQHTWSARWPHLPFSG